MQLEDDLFDGLGCYRHHDDAEVIKLRFRQGQAQYVHHLIVSFHVLARVTSQLRLCFPSEKIIDYGRLLLQLCRYCVQKYVQKLLRVVLVISAEQRHMDID